MNIDPSFSTVVFICTDGEITDIPFIAYLDALGDIMDVKKSKTYLTNVKLLL